MKLSPQGAIRSSGFLKDVEFLKERNPIEVEIEYAAAACPPLT